jgi:hypothetical protein
MIVQARSGRPALVAAATLAVLVAVAITLAGAHPARGATNVPAAVQCPQSPHCWAGTVTMTEVVDAANVEPCCTLTMKTNNVTTVSVSGSGLIVEHVSPTGETVMGGEQGPGSASLDFDNRLTNANCPVGTGTEIDKLFGRVDGDGRVLVIPNDDDHPSILTIGAGVDTNVPTTRTQECGSFFQSNPEVSGAFATQAEFQVPADWDGLHLSGSRTEHLNDYNGQHDRTITWNLSRQPRAGCAPQSFRLLCTPDNPDQGNPNQDNTNDHPPANHPPVAVDDTLTVRAGHALDANLLANDSDPDGDAITAKVLNISFAASEYSGVEPSGDLLYTAGPGTTRTLRKVITYVAVDPSGARSAPAKATITLTVPKGSTHRPGSSTRGARKATTSPVWTQYPGYAWSCSGGGLKTKCWYLLSVPRTAQFDRDSAWTPSLAQAATLCLKYGLIPLKNADCAQKLLSAGVNGLWDRGSIADAARFGSCLLYRVSRHRTFSHPLAGEWGKPEYHPLDSTVRPWDRALSATTGYAKWKKDGLTTERWKLPLFCQSGGSVAVGINVPPETA